MNLTEAYDLCGVSSKTLKNLVKAYTQPHRKYHNLDHLTYMLNQLEENPPVALVEGILFHDVCYSSKPVPPGLNEASSIAVYCSSVEEPKAEVVEMINASAYHTQWQPHISPLTARFLDLDLSGFAADKETFRKHNDQIEEELNLIYEGVATPKQIAGGRNDFLKLMWNRAVANKLFYFRSNEDQNKALRNIEDERERIVTFICS